ncbi:MAG: DUF2855 family protein [Alphaproteobacteria bacterium]|nr:DUF2855 family protein [Alphaproteobacteria bacterium]
MTTSTDLLTSRKNLHETKFVETQLAALKPGQILLKVDTFAFTANNVTYGAFGDAMMYWNFFPAPEGYGRIPVWGFADVVESQAEGIKPGERFWGYYPISTHLVVEPARVTPHGFSDGAAHRQKMAPIYNSYVRVAADPHYTKTRESERALLRPLFTTSFLIDDFLADSDFFGAREVVLSSASSKTSLGLAFLLHKHRKGQVAVVGLTSKSNAAFVEKTGYYDRVVAYDAIAQSPHDKPAVFVDMAGSGEVRAAVHKHWGDGLKYSCAVGATHWDHMGGPAADLPGPKPQLFFAPDQVKKRLTDWGPQGFEDRIAKATNEFIASVDGWMKIVKGKGKADIERVYKAMVDGKAKPEEGHMLSL